MRVNGADVLRRFRIPMRLRVGLRPAGAESGVDFEIAVLRRGEWVLVLRIERLVGGEVCVCCVCCCEWIWG